MMIGTQPAGDPVDCVAMAAIVPLVSLTPAPDRQLSGGPTRPPMMKRSHFRPPAVMDATSVFVPFSPILTGRRPSFTIFPGFNIRDDWYALPK